MLKQILSLLMLAFVTTLSAHEDNPSITPANNDTARVVDIEQVVVIATPKEYARLRQQAVSSTSLSQADMRVRQVTGVKSLSGMVPNLFIPSYGSKLTTSAYIRGIGSRINTPAVGLYVDNIPVVEKSAYDFNGWDIERMDVLRGPQGTLYGRNTMGGLLRVFTKSPFSYQGTDVRLNTATHGDYGGSITHYHRISEHFAFSGGFFGEHKGGIFTNAVQPKKKLDQSDEAGTRLRAIWLPADQTKLDMTVSYEYLDQGAYPYEYQGVVTGEETLLDYVGKIAYNSEGAYRRHLFSAGLNMEHQASAFTFSSVTGLQWLRDRMLMDQDYTPLDLFSLQQRQHSTTLTQELILRSIQDSRWQWMTGASGFYQQLRTDAPVNFLAGGIQSLIETPVNNVFAGLRQQNPRMPEMYLDVLDDGFPIAGNFRTPTVDFAFYHQSTIRDFLFNNFSLTLGLRAEYERQWVDYLSEASLTFDFRIPMLEQVPAMSQTVSQLKNIETRTDLAGKLNQHSWQLLPKVALQYDFTPQDNVYFTLTKGYRSGGYNIQMFSDLIQNGMSADMMAAVDQRSGGMVTQMAGNLGTGTVQNVNAVVSYRPEKSWNYEAGTHLTLFDSRLQADAAMFLMQTRDQQIARFSSGGLGRITLNAGRSCSLGMELSLRSQLTGVWSLYGNYGFTRATFRSYQVSDEQDYTGNSVPFVPRHTFTLGSQYEIRTQEGAWIENILLNAQYTAAGRIYWTEANNASQSLYGTLGGCMTVRHGGMDLSFWVANALNKHYATFYFESMNRAFMQRNNPVQTGIELRYRF